MYFLSDFNSKKIKSFKIIKKDLIFIICVFTCLKKKLKENIVPNKGIRSNKFKR